MRFTDELWACIVLLVSTSCFVGTVWWMIRAWLAERAERKMADLPALHAHEKSLS